MKTKFIFAGLFSAVCSTIMPWTDAAEAHPVRLSAITPTPITAPASATSKTSSNGSLGVAIRGINLRSNSYWWNPGGTGPGSNNGPTTTPGLAGTTSVTTVPTTSQAASAQITSVLNGDWASWTGSANGSLTLADVDKLLTNPNITGSQAAVLGMIADQMNGDISVRPNASPSYSLAQVQQNVFGNNNSESAVFGTSSYAFSYYIQVAGQIASSTNSNGSFNLYGSYTAPQMSSIQQGALGDCYYLASIDAILNQSPQLISKLITQNANGTFTVTFPKATNQQASSETVTLTDSEIADFNIATNNGCWLAVMGLAENDVLVALSNSTNRTTKNAFAVSSAELATPLGVVSDGGYPTQSFNLLTGQAYNAVTQRNYNVTYIDKLLTTDFSGDLAMGVESSDHSLAIIGWNAQTQTVTILNPWGITGPYGYEEDPGVSNSRMQVQMVNGVFTLTTAQMLQDFDEVVAQASLLGSTGTITSAMPHGSTVASVPVSGSLLPTLSLAPHMVPTGAGNIGSTSITLAALTQSNLFTAGQSPAMPASDLSGLSTNFAATVSDNQAAGEIVPVRAKSSSCEDGSLVDTGDYCANQSDDVTASL
jgi:hypothetical protein